MESKIVRIVVAVNLAMTVILFWAVYQLHHVMMDLGKSLNFLAVVLAAVTGGP